MWSRIRPRCATLLGKSIAVAFSNSRSPREYEFATDRRKSRENGLPDEARSPESGYRMAAEGIQFRWRWDSGTISTQLDVIWGMSVKAVVR